MPSRGEVWLVDLGMVQKARPALILNRAFKESDRALISVIVLTSVLWLLSPSSRCLVVQWSRPPVVP